MVRRGGVYVVPGWVSGPALFLLVFLGGISNSLMANEAQARICRAGLNFGQAEARAYLFGHALGGTIPTDQSEFILVNIGNAAAEIGAAEALFGRPFSSESFRTDSVSRLLTSLGGFAETAAGLSYQHEAAQIRTLARQYRATLEYTFMSARLDAFQYNATCDSLLFEACYNYGKATIASAFDDYQSEIYEGAAIGGFWNSVQQGLAVAMDGAGHMPYNGHARKICCTFGTPESWDGLRTLGMSNPMATYADRQNDLLGIIDHASVLDPVCASDQAARCGSSSAPPEKRDVRGGGAGSGVIGEWQCEGLGPGTRIVVIDDGHGGVTLAQKEPRVAIRSGDPIEEVFNYSADLQGGQISWDYGRSTFSARVELALSVDGRNLRGRTTKRYSIGAPWTDVVDVTCQSTAAAPAPAESSAIGGLSPQDMEAIVSFVDAFSASPEPPPASPTSPPAPDPAGQPRWVLTETQVNPKHAPTEFVVGVTPNYYSARMQGSYERWSVSATGLRYSTRWMDHGSLDYDVNLSVAFSPPPAVLVPGQTIQLAAQFSHGGQVIRGNPRIAFEYRGEGLGLNGTTSLNYAPFAPQASGAASISPSFTVPAAGSGEIRLHAFLWNCEACTVTWVYRTQ